ncbi:glycosyl hydrolase [Sporolactobacillus laevolacticus]|uniref:GH26 domain-containing protein n=1 Tax=Sporolactobacillus laevolacticus DSM 442 TaxID=1395513 RepID=V6IWL2_9BACL|nr:glycosyl hydrolase [Sporolactobacillus laevolacticus]EST10976.1 hypothetical protein P343_14280 [Sporolactobacillus laevolacticus DSM 442]
MKKTILLFMVLLLSFVITACSNPKTTSDDQSVSSKKMTKIKDGYAPLEPQRGIYFGIVRDDITRKSIHSYDAKIGITPASYVTFVKFPMRQQDIDKLNALTKEIAPTGGILLITLEPLDGLKAISKKDDRDFAALCAKIEKHGLGVMVRFAHEMNGSWYPWSQQPTLYKEKFRSLAKYIHAKTQNTAMLWAPNSGGGYPFSGGPYEAKRGTNDFSVLDTDKNGKLTMHDDMYTPYYPGDDAVDWVGMSVYHWGNKYPWLENELPEARSFTDYITGNYNGLGGYMSAVPDFYALFCSDGTHKKPMAITETAAFYNTKQKGASELAIKRAWWNQVFNTFGDTKQALDLSVHFPKIKMINWFDIKKKEMEAKGNRVDWRITGNKKIQSAFVHDLHLKNGKNKYLLFAKEFRAQQK